MNLSEVKDKPISELVEIASELGLEDLGRLKKQEIIFRIFKHKASEGTDIYGGGVLEILNDGFGFLRSPQGSYCAGEDDIYVSPSQIRKFGLRKGDSVEGKIRTPKDKERYFALIQVDTINGEEPAKTKNKILFENLTPLFPTERLMLEQGSGSNEDLSSRIIDLIAPVGKGQRGLIVSPPKAGKTLMLQSIAHSIKSNNPEVELIVLLIDERSSLDPLPCSSINLSVGNKGVKFSKRILFFVLAGSSPLIVSTCISAKYLSLSFGVLIFPSTESPFLKPNFLI